MRVAGLYRYPVKSLGGAALGEAAIGPRGIAGDRRWMVVSPEGRFVTRREVAAMAQVHADPVPGGIVLRHGEAQCEVPEPLAGAWRTVTVWGDTVAARDAGDMAALWLGAQLGRAVRLVHMPDDVVRPLDPAYAQADDRTGFADGFPVLVTVAASLAALNAQLARPVAMARFRPNLVIEGAHAFAEDAWRVLKIGGLTLRVVKPCTRCVITTQDPLTGAVAPMGDPARNEPLRTLRAMGRVMPGDRKREPVFGQNAIPDGDAIIAVGDAVEVIG